MTIKAPIFERRASHRAKFLAAFAATLTHPKAKNLKNLPVFATITLSRDAGYGRYVSRGAQGRKVAGCRERR